MRSKSKLMIVMCIMIAVMAVGYGAFSTVLNITGTASITSEWKIVFSSITQQSKTSGVTIKTQPQVSGTSATFDVGLTSPGDKIVYKITLANQGTIDAIVTDIYASASDSPAIIFKVEGVNVGDTLTKKTTKDFIVTIEYDPNITTQPDKLNKTLTVNILTEQKINQNITPSIPSVNQPLYLSSAILKDNVATAIVNYSELNASSKGLYYTSTNTIDNKPTYFYRGNVENNYVKLGTKVVGTCTYNGEQVSHFDEYSSDYSYDVTKSMCTSLTVCIIDSSPVVTSSPEECMYRFDGTDTGEYATYIEEEVGILWRIVRINEDGSIRIITKDVQTFGYYNPESDNAYVGYMYGREEQNGIDAYDLTHSNIYDSGLKISIDNWYKNTLINYEQFISGDAGFCNDRSIAPEPELWNNGDYPDTALGYANNNTYYGAYNRLENLNKPQFACPNEERDLFTLKGSFKGNGALKYPIATITVDELAYSTAAINASSSDSYWIMTPYAYIEEMAFLFDGVSSYYPTSGSGSYSRPVINLKSTAEVSTELPDGCTKLDGTEACPYIIKTN